MNELMRRSKVFLEHNGSTILTCIGGVGVIVTAVLAAKETPKALRLLEQVKEDKGEELTKLETIAVAAPAYIPAIVTCTATLACVFGANILNKRQQASLMSAYALLDSSYKEYKSKVKDIYGEDADERVNAEIAKDNYEDNYEEDLEEEDGLSLFWDSYSHRWFRSTLANVRQAEYETNRDLTLADCVSVNHFYEYLGVPLIENGYDYGWSSEACFEFYGYSWVEFKNTKTVLDDGLECYVISMGHEPVYKYYDY